SKDREHESPTSQADNARQFATQSCNDDVNPEIIQQVTDLIQACYTDMPRISAESLATSDAMSGLVAVQAAHQHLLHSQHAEVDFVLIVFLKLLQQSLSSLQLVISENAALQRSVQNSGVGLSEAPTQ
ncbi:MAG: hypothetical protein U9Q82_10245, partial [Chloroflexota bacterium]|nr:hypothetical protein [Chloroflexota bacterium]